MKTESIRVQPTNDDERVITENKNNLHNSK
jgi:hypothetical protein